MHELEDGPPGLVTERLGRPTRHCEELGSTNDALLAWAEGGATHGAAVRADRQSAGRGRQGRSWWSPPGSGLYFSVLLIAPNGRSLDPSLALVAGTAAAAAIDDRASVEVRLKWPNDLILRGRKLGGILCETRGATTVVGVGINVEAPVGGWPQELAASAIALGEVADAVPSRDELFVGILGALEPRFVRFLESGFGAVRQEWIARDALQRQRFRYMGPDGTESWGVTRGIDSSGGLMISGPDGERTIYAGEVHILGELSE